MFDKKEYNRKWRENHKEEARQYAKDHYQFLKNNFPEKIRDKENKYKEKYPEKVKAKDILNNAVRYNRIKKLPCEVCSEVKVEAHHEDYTKPLDVIWLCVKHHKEIHKIDI